MEEKTTRQKLKRLLRVRESVTPSVAAEHVSTRDSVWRPGEIINQIKELNKSLNDKQVLVAGPQCKSCGFDGFKKRANIPSKCPECYSEWIDEPRFTIE